MKGFCKIAALPLFFIALMLLTGCPQSMGGGSSGGSSGEDYVPFSTVHVQVTDSIGGTLVSGTTLKVYKSGTSEQIGTYTVTNGKVKLENLATGTRYDFELIGIKGEWAGSRLENYKLANEAEQTLSLIQPVHGMSTRGITPPKIVSAKAGPELGPFHDITESTIIRYIGFAKGEVRLVFKSETAAVAPTDSAGFGAKLGIGKAPNQTSGFDSKNIKQEVKESAFISEYEFRLSRVPEGRRVLIAVGYDTANNRIERHYPVTIEVSGDGPVSENLASGTFKKLSAVAERLPYSEGILSLNPVDGRRSSYKMTVRFNFVNASGTDDMEILGFDLYRKEKGSAADFRFVSRTLYNRLQTETERGLGFHAGFDTDSRLEENTEYEYKIRAFNEKYEKFSPVITVKLLESFTYELTSPAKNTYVPHTNTANLAYKCKISNTNMFSPAQSDGISLGLLINKFDGEPVFGAKLEYVFNKKDSGGVPTENPDILITRCNTAGTLLSAPEWVSDLISDGELTAYGIGINGKISDLVKVDTTSGEIEFTEKFLKVPFFNVIPTGGRKGLNKAMSYTAGTAYQWDIQDWGNNPVGLTDDKALAFIKTYQYTDADGSLKNCLSVSAGNNGSNGANAINGRFTFTVTP
ncbi:dentilisin complex subunit PrcA [Treponema sp. HNW]|uniref:dentilisin complex subunit PrcA n=1 Tax=Treponema sp. HNW TaxID=3116654 RepID=UPI003D13141A